MADNQQRRTYTPVFSFCWLAPHFSLQMNPQMALSLFELINEQEKSLTAKGETLPAHLFKFNKSLEQFLLEQNMLQAKRRELPPDRFA